MLIYVLILIALGGGVAGWMGYQSMSVSRQMKSRMASRNAWLKMHAVAKETDAEKQLSRPNKNETD